jgi:hypothetical protein
LTETVQHGRVVAERRHASTLDAEGQAARSSLSLATRFAIKQMAESSSAPELERWDAITDYIRDKLIDV